METHYNTQLLIPIDWADLDLFGHVNNVVYFKYIQTARVNYCEKIGLTSLNTENKLSFMVASSQCQFKKPLLYPNTICVSCKTSWTKNSSFQLKYLITLHNGDLIAEAEDVLVVVDYQQKKKALITEDIKAAMKQLDEAGAF